MRRPANTAMKTDSVMWANNIATNFQSAGGMDSIK